MVELQGAIVGVKFLDTDIQRYGRVVSYFGDHIRIDLPDPPPAQRATKREAQIELILLKHGMVQRGFCKFVSLEEGILELENHAPRSTYRRCEPRCKIQLTVAYRVAPPHRTPQEWRMATTTDISLGGIGMVLPGSEQIPEQLELMLQLPRGEGKRERGKEGKREEKPLYASDANASIQTTAFIKNRRQTSEGETFLGLEFWHLSPQDQTRISDFVARHQPNK